MCVLLSTGKKEQPGAFARLFGRRSTAYTSLHRFAACECDSTVGSERKRAAEGVGSSVGSTKSDRATWIVEGKGARRRKKDSAARAT